MKSGPGICYLYGMTTQLQKRSLWGCQICHRWYFQENINYISYKLIISYKL